MARGTKNHETLANREEERNQALRLWMAGATYTKIADELDISRGCAYNRVQQAIDDMRPHAEFDTYRANQLAELQVGRLRFRAVISRWKHTDDIKRLSTAMDSLIKIQEQEAKLVGLHKIDTPADELANMSDEELGQLIEEWSKHE